MALSVFLLDDMDWESFLYGALLPVTLYGLLSCHLFLRRFLKPARRTVKRSHCSEADSEASAGDCSEDCKMVLCVRQDLGMQKGKIAAQCGHATLSAYKKAIEKNSPFLEAWEDDGQMKVALKVENVDVLNELMSKAARLKLNCAVIRDAGRTQIPAGSITVLAIGPGPSAVIDQVTGHLKLL